MTNDYSLADIAAATGGNNANDGLFGGSWGGIIVLFLLFSMFGWGGYGGWNRGGGGDIQNNYVLTSDFATIERKLDGVNNGLCSGFYQEAQLINGVQAAGAANTAAIQQTLTQGFAGLNTGMVQQGYETRLGINGVNQQLAQCCCDIRGDMAGLNYNIGQQGANISTQVRETGFDLSRQTERGFCDTNFNLQAQHNATMQAIDKVGDRVIDWLANSEAQKLRDENAALRLAASQSAQNSYLISQLKTPCPIPAYTVPNPYCNCNNGCSC